jgi:hypothetical protein
MDCNQHDHFHQLEPTICAYLMTHHFRRDARDFDVNLLIEDQHSCFTELHKFEENVEGNHIFRALKDHLHIVYCIDSQHRFICLRAFHNFKEYKKFLDDKKEILRMIGSRTETVSRPEIH